MEVVAPLSLSSEIPTNSSEQGALLSLVMPGIIAKLG